jgi:hypothetical protein
MIIGSVVHVTIRLILNVVLVHAINVVVRIVAVAAALTVTVVCGR